MSIWSLTYKQSANAITVTKSFFRVFTYKMAAKITEMGQNYVTVTVWVINSAAGCQYFPPGLQLSSQPLRGLLPVSLLGEQRQDGCEQFACDCYPTASRLRFEPGPFCAWVQHANHSATGATKNRRSKELKIRSRLAGVEGPIVNSWSMMAVIVVGPVDALRRYG